MPKKKIDNTPKDISEMAETGTSGRSLLNPSGVSKEKIENIPEDVYEDDSKLSDLNLSILVKYIKECERTCDFFMHGGIELCDISSDIKQRAKFAEKILLSFSEKVAALFKAKKDEKKYLTALNEIQKKGKVKMHNILSPRRICTRLEIYGEIFYRFISTKYKAPIDLAELQRHLEAIYLFYLSCTAIPKISYNLLLKMDYALAGLSYNTAILDIKPIATELERQTLSKKLKQSKKAERAQPVIEEYYRLRDEDKISKHRIASTIQARLKQWGKKAPHTDTIKNYLIEEGLMKK